MSYAYLTFGQAASILASRLEDVGLLYWNQPNELLNCVIEAVRTHNALTGSYKQQLLFSTSPNVPYYDLTSASLIAGNPMTYNATDVEVTNNVLAALLEPPLTAGWTGTGQFTFTQLQNAIQHRLNRFLGDTGCTVAQTTVSGVSTELATLPDATLDVRRVAWVSAGLEYALGRSDEWAEQAYIPDETPANPPSDYSVFATSPLQLRLIPPPSGTGNLDCLVVNAGATLNLNPSSPVLLGIPDDFSPALKWGMLSDLLSGDGLARDPARAQYAEERYQEFVQVASAYPSVLTSFIGSTRSFVDDETPGGTINGTNVTFTLANAPVPPASLKLFLNGILQVQGVNYTLAGNTITFVVAPTAGSWLLAYYAIFNLTSLQTAGIGSVFDLDFFQPDWQQTTGTPGFVGMCGRNLACLGPVPDSAYAVGLWATVNAPVTGGTGAFIQVARDQLEPILDLAEHIACFKMAGQEFTNTTKLYQNLVKSAMAQNKRLSAVSFYRGQMQQFSDKSELEVERMLRD